MFVVRHTESLDLAELRPYRTMRQQQEQRDQGIFVAEGEKVVRRLLESELGVVSLLIPQEWLLPLKPLLEARQETVQVFIAPKSALEEMTGFTMYQGLLAIGRIPPARSLEDILSKSPRPWLLVAAEGISNGENLGALARNCAAFGAHALLTGESSGSPYLRRAVRSSMGTILKLPAIELSSLSGALRELRAKGVRVVAAHPRANAVSLGRSDFSGDLCLVFGSEGQGLTGETLALCDDTVAIPMANEIDSLNVASAGAAFLYEVQRQRSEAGNPACPSASHAR
jgi:tRNA G18 (ribose-2'-O)-methylase SpoU